MSKIPLSPGTKCMQISVSFSIAWQGRNFPSKAQWERRVGKMIGSLQSRPAAGHKNLKKKKKSLLTFALAIHGKLWHLLSNSQSLLTSWVRKSLRLDQQTLLSVEREKKFLTAAKSCCDLIKTALDFVKSNSHWWSGAAEGGGWVTDIYEPTHSARHWSSWEKIFTADRGIHHHISQQHTHTAGNCFSIQTKGNILLF